MNDEHLKAVERREWVNLWRVYERCVEIAELVWQSKLKDARTEQREIAEAMRDRLSWNEAGGKDRREIPVPLFTPRDRQQFLKEVAATLLISADRRQLNVRFPKEKPTNAEAEPQTGTEAGVEAASGAAEEALDGEAGEIASAATPG